MVREAMEDKAGSEGKEDKVLGVKPGRVDTEDRISREDSAVTTKVGLEDRTHMDRVGSEDKAVKGSKVRVDRAVLEGKEGKVILGKEVSEVKEDMEVLILMKSQRVTT